MPLLLLKQWVQKLLSQSLKAVIKWKFTGLLVTSSIRDTQGSFILRDVPHVIYTAHAAFAHLCVYCWLQHLSYWINKILNEQELNYTVR